MIRQRYFRHNTKIIVHHQMINWYIPEDTCKTYMCMFVSKIYEQFYKLNSKKIT